MLMPLLRSHWPLPALALALLLQAPQLDAPLPTAAPPASAAVPAAAEPAATSLPSAQPAPAQATGGISEAELKQMLVGKALYLRGGYLSDGLSFDEHGKLIGHSPQGSYTLSAIQIDRVRLTKHKVELIGARYGLRFVGQLAYEDPSKALERVRITPKKREVRITIDREMVVNPKKRKAKVEKGIAKKSRHAAAAAPAITPAATPKPSSTPAQAVATPPAAPTVSETPAAKPAEASAPTAAQTPAEAQTPPAEAAAASKTEAEAPEADTEVMTPEEQLQASIAETPEAERPADPKSVTTTISPAHAAGVLKDALDVIFAQGLDDRMMAAMPDFWKLYYQAAADRVDYRPKDPAILRQNTVDKKARLLTNFEPDSNEFAQASGVAGMAQYHAVVEADGTVGEVVVSRPIGFGLDESAVAAIKKAKFEPAIYNDKPVAVFLDLNVPFRIFSKRTNVHAPPEAADKPAEPILPGPYSVPRP